MAPKSVQPSNSSSLVQVAQRSCDASENLGILLAVKSRDELLPGGPAKRPGRYGHARVGAQLTKDVGREYAPAGRGAVQEFDGCLERRFVAATMEQTDLLPPLMAIGGLGEGGGDQILRCQLHGSLARDRSAER